MGFFPSLASWLFSCSHRKTTFPVTIPAKAGVEGRPSTPPETYVVCLECGHHIPYDWATMRITGRRSSSVECRGVSQ